MLLLLLAAPARAQQDGLLQIDDPLHDFLLRQQTAGLLRHAHLGHQSLSAYEARRYLDSLALRRDRLTPVDRRLLDRFRGDAPGPGAAWAQRYVPFLYRNGRDLLSVAGDDYALQLNPLLYLSYGRARQTELPGRETSVSTWQNTRGLRASGHVTRYIFFEARIEETQRRDVQPVYVQNTAPRLGSVQFDDGVYDYTVATGIVGFTSEHFEVRFGRDRNRWAFGSGSLFLSNYAPVYDQLQIRTSVWQLQYDVLFARFTDLSPLPPSFPDQVIPRKYGAFHRLTIDLPARLQLELFDGIIFFSPDEAGRREGFELAYLNPVIFFRAVETDLGSPDNALIGGGVSWVALPGLKLYTQLLIDDLKVDRLGDGWWGNKLGWLFGVHTANLGLDNLSVRLEYARVQPYTYGHEDLLNTFVHYNDLLGYPTGPNTEDVALRVDYQPAERLRAALNLAFTRRGRNTDAVNYGSDPLRPETDRPGDTGIDLLQGVRQQLWLVEAHAGYELLPDLFIEGALRMESTDDEQTGLDRYVAPFVLLRWGLPFQSVRY